MDEKSGSNGKKNPREGANFLSALTFSWTLKTFWVGFRREIEIEDLPRPLREHKSSYLGDKMSVAWEAELQRVRESQKKSLENGRSGRREKPSRTSKPSLTRVLIKVFGLKTLLYGLALGVMEIFIRVLQPLFLGNLLQFYSGENPSSSDAYLYAGGIVLCSATVIFFRHPFMMAAIHMGMKVRVACCSLIYRKTLKLSKTALGQTTVGQAVNLLSNDVNRFDEVFICLHYLWIGPLQTLLITYFLYEQVGLVALTGVALLLVYIPLQGLLGKKSSVLRLRIAMRTDERIRLTNEIITGIQAIKMYTWENPFRKLVEKARRREINVIRSTSFVRGVMMSFKMFTSRLTLFVTVLVYVLSGQKLTAEKVFLMTAYYSVLKLSMTDYFPRGITQVAEVVVTIKRLQNFMLYDEIDDITKNRSEGLVVKKEKQKGTERTEKPVTGSRREGTGGDGSVVLNNCHAKWLDSASEDTLRGINFKVNPGQLVAVVGQVGSGKSSLLNVILKELPVHQGSVEVNGHVAYASQEAWLFSGSVRQNILFGRKMEPRRYEKVVKVCQLKRDFALLPYGDKTIVGERGISLSGGQRARINLARAVYADAPICLLDDPLSAVDAHVGKQMFEECIEMHLRGKTRLLVTHQLQFLRNVDWIVVLKEGAIQAEGTFEQLAEMGVDIGELLEPESEQDDNSAMSLSRSDSHRTSCTSLNSVSANKTFDDGKEDAPGEIAETRTKGSLKGRTYSSYFQASGSCPVVFVVLSLCVLAQLAASCCDYFIALWVNMEERVSENKTLGIEQPGKSYERPLDTNTCIYIYSAVTVIAIILVLMRSVSFFDMCMRASIKLHDRMFRSISRASMYFFNTNPSGRVLNRFARDMGSIDESLPMTMFDCIQIGLSLTGTVVVIGIANPWLMIPTVAIGVFFYFLRIFYLKTSRSVKRLEGIARSPVYNHLNATLQGLVTIRSFDAAEVLTTEFDHHQDLHSSAWYIFLGVSRAFGYWLDLFCLLYIALVTMSFLVPGNEEDPTSTPGGNVGLAITQSIGLTGMFQWGMRQTAEMENQMTSVERVLEYSSVESEPPLESAPGKKPKDTWPEEGKVEFKNVHLRYSPLDPPVLKNLNFVVKPREKIGIVGRTGAGKSSLIQALFRLADVEGAIEIDGVDTSEMGLHDLRSKISIIPQEPFLFSGSMRFNLDPFEAYSDIRLLEALEEVELKEMGLESHVNEGGSNLSVGQRQLVCLARAIVRNNPILVLDEATANVDPRTDELIQKTIRRKFENRTVLTIAHRLNTVMDSDRILVMDAGSVVEFDHPHVLLQNTKSGYLHSMVQETGASMAQALTEVAEKSYSFRQTSTNSEENYKQANANEHR
ncbi:probable multidrug resistance-associated protein lethal(2)03659 [Venturia canescens]|uniref:probable multidrug resistance-associated protein lethal(2)03659 n=1 Tax=Venturia canescens TaxID=32260 RepID=UPI001C9BBEC5|nr:probable multidrug resistance-associated protein lethal(2)03659 [Venturia canescens]XP_043284649.1 probable multidrug resistance-associated protein lethal(2)03659 [Venturia canescens]